MQAGIFSSPGMEGSKRDEARVEGPGEERRRLPVAAAEHLGDARGHEARHEAEQHEGHDLQGAVNSNLELCLLPFPAIFFFPHTTKHMPNELSWKKVLEKL